MKKHARSKPSTLTTQKQSNRRRKMRWLLTSTLIIFSCAGLSLAGWLFSNGIPRAGATAQQSGDISPPALEQIEALLREKDSRKGAQRKIDSQLIYALKMWRDETIAEGVQTLETDVQSDSQGNMIFDLKVNNVSDALLNQLKAYGANIVDPVPEQNSVRIEATLDKVEAIAALPDVMFVGPKQEATTSRVVKAAQDGPQSDVGHDPEPGAGSRAARVRNFVSAALQEGPLVNAGSGVGSQSTEGDVAHRAPSAR